jgi:DNA polymerase elongation subunit (family B)
MIKNKVLHTSNSGDKVYVKYETPSGEKKEAKIDYKWYFLVDAGKKAYELIDTIGNDLETDDKIPGYIRVFIKDSKKRSDYVLFFEEHGIPTYEGDLLLDKRWYIDQEVEIGSSFTKLYVDIETDDSAEKINIGHDRILSYAAIDDQGKIYFECLEEDTDESEKKLMKKFLRMIKKYDILLGWNSSEFDIPYLRERMVKYDLHKTDDYCWRNLAKYDLLKRFRHIFRFDSHIKSFSLDFVSHHFLGRGKIKHNAKIIELWRHDKERLKAYNIEDSILVRDLDNKLGVSNMMIRQCQWCGVPPAQFGLYSIIDAYILKKAHQVGKYVRTSIKAITERKKKDVKGYDRTSMNPDDTETDKAKYIGAIVLDPVIGKYDNVYTFDFKGLYPSMMRTSNIGYDTLRYDPSDTRITNPGTLYTPRKSELVVPTYFEKEPSIINLAITDLIKKRGEYKDLKLKMIEDGTNKGVDWERVVSDEIIVKELANSTYGIMGLDYGRYFSIDVAESITLFGQWCISFAKKHYQSLGYHVIYGDTDSVFVHTGKEKLDVDKSLEQFHIKLKEELKSKYNIDDCFIQLNFDKQYDSFILIAKKTYVGHVVNIEGKKTDDIYARGLEFHKKNTFSYAAKKQKELIDNILSKNPKKEVLYDWCQDVRRDFYRRDFTKEELVITQKVGKRMDDYSKTPPVHVRLAQKMKEDTGVDMFRSEIDYIITSRLNNKFEGVLAEDYDGNFNRDFYWENKTMPILERITQTIYPGFDCFAVNLTLF